MVLLIQLLGIVAFIFLFISYILKNKENIVVFQLISYIIFSIHYLMLGAFTGSLFELCCAASSFVTQKRPTKRKNYLIAFSIIYLLIVIVSFAGWYSIIPGIICFLTTLALLYGNAFAIRVMGLINCLGWGLYSYFVKSYSVMISNIFLFIFILICIALRSRHEK